MIQANELRIGNYFNTTGGIKKVHGVLAGHNISVIYFGKKNEEHIGSHMASPIPITPEILAKCGLNRNSEGWFLDTRNMIYDPLEINGVGDYSQRKTKCFAFKHGDNILRRGVQYLHQLQNLYFALTGEELEVKL